MAKVAPPSADTKRTTSLAGWPHGASSETFSVVATPTSRPAASNTTLGASPKQRPGASSTRSFRTMRRQFPLPAGVHTVLVPTPPDHSLWTSHGVPSGATANAPACRALP